MATVTPLTDFNDDSGIIVQPMPDENDNPVSDLDIPDGYWAGMSADQLHATALQLYALGTLSSAQYIVELEPYEPDSAIAGLPLFELQELPWLAISTSMSVMDAQTNSVQVGHYQLNHITGNGTNEVQVTFLETQYGHIFEFAKQVRNIMFPRDGTQALPYDYLMRLTVSLFPRHDRGVIATNRSWVVALQAASVDLAASNSTNPVEVPLTFIKMFPMLD